MTTHMNASTGEYTKPGRRTFKEAFRDAQVEVLQGKLRKVAAKFPASAPYLIATATGESEMRIMAGLGWEVVGTPSDHMYRSPIRIYTMKISRTDFEAL